MLFGAEILAAQFFRPTVYRWSNSTVEKRQFEGVVAEIQIEKGVAVGSKSAGWICIPSGKLHLEDFVDDRREFQSIVEDAIRRRSSFAKYDMKIELLSISSNLCARNYGMFGLGSGLIDQSQKMTVAARAMAEKKTVGHRS